MIKELNKILKKENKKKIYFRIHVEGEFYNREYFKKWLDIVKKFPNVIFWTYTKNLEIFNNLKEIPKNLYINLSIFNDVNKDNLKKSLKIAEKFNLNLVSNDKNLINNKKIIKCNGYCIKCKACYNKNKNIYIENH